MACTWPDSWDAVRAADVSCTRCAGGALQSRRRHGVYSDGLLQWWKANNPTIPSWAKEARMVLALTITSAASERVFSLVKSMYGKGHDSALADELHSGLSDAALQNKRSIG